ncbi:MAG: ABC transporter ATP-binding protein [Pseudomonadota bacterium]
MHPDTEPLLVVEQLSVSYGKGPASTVALRGATFAIGRGEIVGVIGESGSGKSTLARTVLGLVRPSTGTVRVAGEELTSFSERQWREFRRRGVVQYVFQDPLRSLDPELTIAQSLAEPLVVQGRPQREIDAAVVRYLEQMKLDPSLAGRFPGELSGGQRQRVAVARALCTEPELLILDEPVSALDAANRVQVLEILAALRARGVSLLFISHDLGSVAGIADRIVVLYRGSIVELETAGAIVQRPRHPYTRLLVASAPTLLNGSISREHREQLRADLRSEEASTIQR